LMPTIEFAFEVARKILSSILELGEP